MKLINSKVEILEQLPGLEGIYKQIFELRCSKAAHSDAQKLANELKELMHK